MYLNDFGTAIISTNVRNVLNDSFGSRTELVQNVYDTSSISKFSMQPQIIDATLYDLWCNAPCRLPPMKWHSACDINILIYLGHMQISLTHSLLSFKQQPTLRWVCFLNCW